jgi:hypothetical protein
VTSPSVNHFDRGKPFYPLVMDFIAGLYGWLALWSRGVGLAAAEVAKREKLELGSNLKDVPIEALAAAAQLPSVVKPLELSSRVQGGPVKIDHDELAAESIHEFAYLVGQAPRAAEHLLVLAWETTHRFRTGGTRGRHPLWQFLRHCRHRQPSGFARSDTGAPQLAPPRSVPQDGPGRRAAAPLPARRDARCTACTPKLRRLVVPREMPPPLP